MTGDGSGTGGEESADVVVVGAGLAGLTAAVVAARAGCRVTVCDGAAAGGRARTEVVEGYHLDQGPHALFGEGPGWDTLRELGMEPDAVAPDAAVVGWREGRFPLLPTSASSLLQSSALGFRAKYRLARLLKGLGSLDTGELAPMSAQEWVAELGLPGDGEAMLAMFLRTTSYAEDLSLVSADALARQVQLLLSGGLRYVHGGWSRLVDELLDGAASAGARLLERTEVRAVSRTDAGGDGPGWTVATTAGAIDAAAVVLACGGSRAVAGLISFDPRWEVGPEATAARLSLGTTHRPDHPIVFGLDEPVYLAQIGPPSRLSPDGGSVVQLVRYGTTTGTEDRELLWRLARGVGLDHDHVIVERFDPCVVVGSSLPVPGRGLAGRPDVAVDGAEGRGLFVAGDWVGPVGLLADAALRSGAEAGRAAARAGARGRPSRRPG